MDHAAKINSILDDADQKLLELIAKCASAGDLQGVDAARGMAGRLRSLRGSFENGAAVSRQDFTGKKRGGSSSKRIRPGKETKFPRFELRNATLYRIGWSKKKNEHYEHKVPHDTVSEVVNAMVSLSQSGSGPFTVEQIARRTDQISSVSVPSYQIYVVIGWLRVHNLIEQIGRNGYQLPNNLAGEFDALWKSSNAAQQ
ncbi:MAG: hypothetical protein IH991_21480 [Planctomycetes bacterium]|nr:hypothetical protein [Planctomycetota bacterium]